MPRLIIVVAAAAIMLLAVLTIGASDTRASHGSDPYWGGYYWGHYFTFWDLYPSCTWPGWGNGPCRDHNLRYRACISHGDEAGYSAWNWTYFFGFNSGSTLTSTLEPNCGVGSDVLFWATTDSEVNNKCGVTAIACFDPGVPAYDSFVGRWEVTSAVIRARQSWLDSHSQSWNIHVYEHEVGHGMGLAHHAGCEPYVMEDPPCSGYWVTNAEIVSARCIYIYAC
jgi:hypothetical protein